jgi:double-stranded uracil-DNA glycosylase
MDRVELSIGFPPVVGGRAKVLILGSLPGRRSLEAREYYAQPQNAFWRIMRELVGAGPELDYESRLDRLSDAQIALWDVLAAGERPGSLDASIVKATAIVNDFPSLFARAPGIELICFNGRTAEALFDRRVAPTLAPPQLAIARLALPSTSPAYASMPFSAKLERWSVVRAHLSGGVSGRRRS